MAEIEIKNLDFAYNKSLVLRNINYSFEQGKLISIAGPNGSGKSTLLKCINRIIRPVNGSVVLNGKDIARLRLNELARKMAYVPQSEGGTFPATVFDTVLLGRKPYIQWSPQKKDLEITASIIEMLDLKKIALRNINQLSGGQRQRVFIARALAQEPEILLLDEPTANLDLKHQMEVLSILRKLTTKGITAIMAIHDLNLALQYSDNFVLLKGGEIFASGGKEVISNKNIEKLYDVKVKIVTDNGYFIIVPQTVNEQH